jgi:hypothetical protein
MKGLVLDLLLPGLFQDHGVVVAAVALHLVLHLDVVADDFVVAQRVSHPWSVQVGEEQLEAVVLRLSVPLHPTLAPRMPQRMDSDVVPRWMTCC